MIRTATGDRIRARLSREELTRSELRPAAEQGPIPPHLLPASARPKQAKREERIQTTIPMPPTPPPRIRIRAHLQARPSTAWEIKAALKLPIEVIRAELVALGAVATVLQLRALRTRKGLLEWSLPATPRKHGIP